MELRPRLVPLDGAFNFRDLGGYPTRDGRATRWATVFRSDTLHELTGQDVDTLRAMGLSTIIDLRTSAELERTGRGPLGPEPIDFRHLSVIQDAAGEAVAAPAPAGEDLYERYLWYLDVGRRPLIDALTLLAEPASLPLVFHCAAGKDRTGVLAALMLDILGVEPEVIVADYVITASRMDLIMGRYRSDPAFAERVAQVPPGRFGVEEATMAGFLAELYRRFGGARAWTVASGLAPEQLDRMEELLLESAD